MIKTEVIDLGILESLVIVLGSNNGTTGKGIGIYSDGHDQLVDSVVASAKYHLVQVAESLILRKVLAQVPGVKSTNIHRAESNAEWHAREIQDRLNGIKMCGIDGLQKAQKETPNEAFVFGSNP
jgi:hypothetical protein